MWVILKRHTVCEKCLKRKNKCPIDNKKIDKGWTGKDYTAITLFEKFKIFCENKKLGCPWKKELEFYSKHKTICPYKKN